MELRGLTRRLSARGLDWPVAYAAEVETADERWILVANGAGQQAAREAFQVARERTRIDAIVSTGYCGALDPRLRTSDVVVATSVCSASGNFRAEKPQVQGKASPAKASIGAMFGSDEVLQSARSKSAARARSGAVAVDMESHALAAEAAQAGLPFYCVRAVTDVAGEDMAFDFNAVRSADGRIPQSRVVSAALHHPVRHMPGLIKLAYRGWRASIQLGDFLAACHF
jgi:adenosylhomocysteine nucleosidase